MRRSTLDSPEFEFSAGPTRPSKPAATPAPRAGRPGTGQRFVVLGAVFAAGAVLLALAVMALGGSGSGADDVFVVYTVKRSDVPITVTERNPQTPPDTCPPDQPSREPPAWAPGWCFFR